MRIRTVFVAAVLTAVAALPLAAVTALPLAAVTALPLAGVASFPLGGVASASADPVRDCHGFSGRAAARWALPYSGDAAPLDADHDGIACGDRVGRHELLMARRHVRGGSTVPSHGSVASRDASGDAGALLLAGLGAVAALGAAYGVVRRSPGRPRLRSRSWSR